MNILNKFLRVDRYGRGLWHNEMIKVPDENYVFMGDQVTIAGAIGELSNNDGNAKNNT